jgi:hypothetical protein
MFSYAFASGVYSADRTQRYTAELFRTHTHSSLFSSYKFFLSKQLRQNHTSTKITENSPLYLQFYGVLKALRPVMEIYNWA